MKIHFEHKSTVIEFERTSMEPECFTAVCRLAGRAITGGVLLGAIHMVGIWAVVWTAGVLLAYGIYKTIQNF